MRKKIFLYAAMLAVMLGVIELFAFLFVGLIDRDEFFDHRQTVIERFVEADLQTFRERVFDPDIGWRNYGPSRRSEPNCRGEAIEYSYDEYGARLHETPATGVVQVLAVGDSYTNGAEAHANDTYPAQLSRLLGVPVANQGVGGHGPAQAFLNLKQKRELYPQASIAVLAIMTENLYRMMNAYRPVLYSGTASAFTLKPYMREGQLVMHPGEHVLADLEAFEGAVQRAFDQDFWAKPAAQFPYTVSIFRSLGSNYTLYRKLQKELRKVGLPEYSLIFRDSEVTRNLLALLNQYAKWSSDNALVPVAVFIPRNRLDLESASTFIERHRHELAPELVLGDVASMAGVDWERFNLLEPEGDNICHPSAYGYGVIARYTADLVLDAGVDLPIANPGASPGATRQ